MQVLFQPRNLFFHRCSVLVQTFTVVPYQELVSLSEAKESLEKQLTDMEAQVSKLQKPESLEPTPAASPAMTGPEGEGGIGGAERERVEGEEEEKEEEVEEEEKEEVKVPYPPQQNLPPRNAELEPTYPPQQNPMPEPAYPPQQNPQPLPFKAPKCRNREVLALQLRDKLGGASARLSPNGDALIRATVGTTKKVLPHEADFYQVLAAHNLQGLIRNKAKFQAYLRASLFKL